MTRLAASLTAARSRLPRTPALAPARAELDTLIATASDRMRVALVGRASAGKSTLANALLGGYRAPTGVQELTYNVNWITHGPKPSLTVHFKDGRPPERRDIGELERLTVRAADDDEWMSHLKTIAYLRLTDPARYLRSFDLVDTPGLDSVFGTDSENTLRFLGGPVDALVLVFSRAMAAAEPDLLAGFQGRAMTPSPINAIAALTKVERLWSWPDEPDPLALGREVAAQMMAVPAVRRVTYGVHPVASLVGAAAGELDETDLADLTTLATLDEDTLGRRLRRADAFATREFDDVPLPAERRAHLIGSLTGYGIMLAAQVLREGVADLPSLRRELDIRSGMAGFRTLLVDHFGNRAELIMLNRVFGRVQALLDSAGPRLPPRDRAALTDAVREFGRHALADGARFRELEALRAFYEGRLDLCEADGAELLRATGEHGSQSHALLGLPADTAPAVLATTARQRLRYWRERDAWGGFAGPTRVAVSVLVRTYERLVGRLDEIADGRDDARGRCG
jgi:Dynamin family